MTDRSLRLWSPSLQAGLSLFPALIFMLVLAMLGVAAMSNSTMQEKMAGNSRDLNVAFQAAEAGLRDAEADIAANITLASPFTPECRNGLCTAPSTWATPVSTDISKLVDWSNPGTTRAYGSGTGAAPLADVAAQPVYVIERMSDLPASAGSSAALGVAPRSSGGTAYRVTVLATGARAETRTFLQSTYIVRRP